ncbi:MAG: MFS transporter [Clostridiaceae bacterium]|nr:MFS transporter [Clostridiaceae bacterium]
MKNSKNNIYTVDFLMSFIAVFGVVMFLPMLPHIQQVFGVSVSQISWIPNVGYLTMIIFSSFVGKIINKVGIKRLLLFSLILWIMGISIEILALNNLYFNVFITGRVIEGIGEAFIFPLLLSMNKVGLRNKGNEKVGLSLIEFGAALGGLIAAIIAGQFINNPKQFLIIPISIAVLAGLFIFIRLKLVVLKELEDKEQDKGIKEGKKTFISLLLMIFMIQTIFASIQVYLAYYMEAFSLPNLTGAVISIEQIIVALGTITPIFFFKRVSFKSFRNIIVLVFVFGTTILGMQVSIYISVVALSIIAFFVGASFTYLNIYLSKIIKTKAAQKLSLYTSIRYTGGFVLSFSWGKLIENYRGNLQGYAEIFRRLYIFEGIMVVGIFLVVIFLQGDLVSIFKPKSRKTTLMDEVEHLNT